MSFIPIIRGVTRDWFNDSAARVNHTVLADRRHRLTFVLSRPLIEALQWQGGDRVVMGLGVGEDAGRFQLTRVGKKKAGMTLERRTPNSFRLSINLPPVLHGIDFAALFEPHADAAHLDHDIRDTALLARLRPVVVTADQTAVVPLRVTA